MTLKKTLLTMLPLFLVLAFIGCSKNSDQQSSPTSSVKLSQFQVQVTDGSNQVPNAKVLIIYDDNSDLTLSTDTEGKLDFETNKKVSALCAMTLGYSGYVTDVSPGNIRIAVEAAPAPDTSVVVQKPSATYYFGVYDTDGNGDVRFRYQYNFSYYYCNVWLPGWPYGDPNPNHWDGWNITDCPSPWKGKKLLVPRRYQIYCQNVYGFSISNVLILVATS